MRSSFDAPRVIASASAALRNPLPLQVRLADDRLAALLLRAAKAAGRAVPDVRVREILRRTRGTGRGRMVRAAAEIGLRATVVTSTVADAVADSASDAPLFALVGEGSFVAFEGAIGERARIIGSDDEPSDVELDIAAKRLGLIAATDEACFLSFDPVDPGAAFREEGSAPGAEAAWRTIGALVSAEREDLGAIVVYCALVGLASLAVPLSAQAIVGCATRSTASERIIVLVLAVLVALAFATAWRAAHVQLSETLRQRFFVQATTRLAGGRGSCHVAERWRQPARIERFFEALTVHGAAAQLALDGLALAIRISVGFALLALFHPLLLALDLVLVLVLAVVVSCLAKGGSESAIIEGEARRRVFSWLREVACLPTAFSGCAREGYARDEMDERLRAYLHARRARFRLVVRQMAGAGAVHSVTCASMLGVGATLVLRHELSLGQLVAAVIVVCSSIDGIVELARRLEPARDLLAATRELGVLVGVAPESRRGSAPRGEGALELVCEVNGRSCRVAPGERVAVIRNLRGVTEPFERLFGVVPDPSIRVDAVPLSELSLSAYRDEVALVRDAEVFEGTLLDNVRAGRDLSCTEVRHALRAVALDDLVDRLPTGVYTPLATNGHPLTPDEARRLTIARALAGRPRMLLLDGALDGLSPRIRSAIVYELGTRRRQTTVLVGTQVPEVAATCDRALHVPRGLEAAPS